MKERKRERGDFSSVWGVRSVLGRSSRVGSRAPGLSKVRRDRLDFSRTTTVKTEEGRGMRGRWTSDIKTR